MTVARLALVWLALGVSTLWSSETTSKLHWHHDYGQALQEAKKSGRPIFLEFRCAP